MSKKSRTIILLASVAVIVAIAIIYSIYHNKVSLIPEGTLGNTPGNLNNHGLFCEYDQTVYFANPYDNNALYSMKPDGSNIKKLCDMSVEYINAGGKYVFFYGEPNSATSGIGSVVSKPGMYMIDNDGDNLTALTKDVSRSMILYGNDIYYQHYTKTVGTTLAVLNVPKHQSRELLDYMINPACLYSGNIYYNGMYKDHYLYSYNIATETETCLWEGDIWNPIYDGNYVYYMDVLNDYRLCRYSITDNTIEILTDERTDFFNLYGNVIYYQVSSPTAPALKRLTTDTLSSEIVAQGVYTGINVTSEYVYFTEFGADYPLYRTPTFGAVNVTEFTAARDALLANIKKKD